MLHKTLVLYSNCAKSILVLDENILFTDPKVQNLQTRLIVYNNEEAVSILDGVKTQVPILLYCVSPTTLIPSLRQVLRKATTVEDLVFHQVRYHDNTMEYSLEIHNCGGQ